MKTVIGRARLIVDPSRGNYIYPIIWKIGGADPETMKRGGNTRGVLRSRDV